MRCHHTEWRLQELLDSRQHVSSDVELSEHLRRCDGCRRLADAYMAMAAGAPVAACDADISGLSERVVQQVCVPTAAAKRPQRPAWSAVAIAASLLVVCSAGFYVAWQHDTHGPANAGLADQAPAVQTSSTLLTDRSRYETAAQPELLGGEVWYRTGRGLATISLAGLRTNETTAIDAESNSDQQLLNRALDALRQIWPAGSERPPHGRETGWHARQNYTLVA